MAVRQDVLIFGKPGIFMGRNAGASCVEAICAKRRYVIFTNLTTRCFSGSVIFCEFKTKLYDKFSM